MQAAQKRLAHRRKRPRRPMVGMTPHLDASTHAWPPCGLGRHDLVATMEDATGAIYSMFPVDEEGTASSLRDVIARHGLFRSLLRTGLGLTINDDIQTRPQDTLPARPVPCRGMPRHGTRTKRTDH